MILLALVAQVSQYICLESHATIPCDHNRLRVPGSVFQAGKEIDILDIAAHEDLENPIDTAFVRRKLEIHGNGNSTVRLFSSKPSRLQVILHNVTAIVSGDSFSVAHLELDNSILIGAQSFIQVNSITTNLSELVDVEVVKAQCATITIDTLSSNKTVLFDIQILETDEPQVILNILKHVDMVFCANSLLFFPRNSQTPILKVFGNEYPRIEIHHIEGEMLVSCSSGLIPSVLLSPIIYLEPHATCVFGGDNWPLRSRRRPWYWKFERFYEADERTIWVVVEPESELVIDGNDIPISVRAEEGDPVSITAGRPECGITGGIILNENTRSIVHYSITEPGVMNLGFLFENGGTLLVENKLLTVRFDSCNFSNVVVSNGTLECRTIQNWERNVKHRVKLMANGTIFMKLSLPFNEVYNRIKNGYLRNTHFPDSVYTSSGGVNIKRALEFAGEWMNKNRLKMAGIFQVLSKFGNTVDPLNITYDPEGNYSIRIARDDVPMNSFYTNPYKYGRAVFYTPDDINMSHWNIEIEPFHMSETQFPVRLSEMSLKPAWKVSRVDDFQRSLRWSLSPYPNSAIEVFVFCEDKLYNSGLSYINGMLFHFVKAKDLPKLSSKLSNSKTKNVVFIALTDPYLSPNFQGMSFSGFRPDVNLVLIGLTIPAIQRMNTRKFRVDFSSLARFDIDGSFGSLYAAFIRSDRFRVVQARRVGLVMNSFKAIDVSADDIVTDFTALKKIPQLRAKRMMVIPVNGTADYPTLSSVQFTSSGWTCEYDNVSVKIPKKCATEGLQLFGRFRELTLHMATNSVTETIIGPDFHDSENGTSDIIGIPLLSNDPEPVELVQRSIKTVIELLNRNNPSASLPTVKFTGNWTQAVIPNNGIRVKISDETIVENFPANHTGQIDVKSDRRIHYSTLESDVFYVNTPQLVRGTKEFVLPNGTDVVFDNVTFLSKASKFSVAERPILTVNHIRNGRDASANLTHVNLTGSIHLLERSSMRIDVLSASPNAELVFDGSFEDRFPLLCLGSSSMIPKIIVNVHEPACAFDEILTQSQKILEMSTTSDRCSEVNVEIHSPNEAVNITSKCEFNGQMLSLTLNTTVDIEEEVLRFVRYGGLSVSETASIPPEYARDRSGMILAIEFIIGAVVLAAAIFIWTLRTPREGIRGFNENVRNEMEEELSRGDADSVPVIPEDALDGHDNM